MVLLNLMDERGTGTISSMRQKPV